MEDKELYLVPVTDELMHIIEMFEEFTDEEQEDFLEFLKAMSCEPQDYLPC